MSKVPDENKLIEALVVSHLARNYGINYVKRNGEVDIVVRQDDELIGFEVKFGKVKKTLRILGKMKKVFVLSREVLDEGIIPVSLFLAMLDMPQFFEIRL